MAIRVRQTNSALYKQFTTTRAPLGQVVQASWAALLVLLLSIVFIVVVARLGHDQQYTGWISSVPVMLSVGGVVLRGALAALLGLALYQHLWSRLANSSDDNNGRKATGYQHPNMTKSGLSIRQVDSYHRASRLSVLMFFRPSLSWGWAIGAIGLAAVSAVIPVLQASVDTVQRTEVRPVRVSMWHAQLDARLSKRSGAAGYPDGPKPNVRRAATTALLGEESSHSYTDANVTGAAEFGPIQYADIDCDIRAAEGQVVMTTRTHWYYNFTARFTDYLGGGGAGALPYISTRLAVNATLNNGTHFLYHTCAVRPARGSCAVALVAGSGRMRDLRCRRARFLDADSDVPNDNTGPGAGFMAIAGAFGDVFAGEAWTSRQQGRPQENSTFAQLARFSNRTTMVMPPDLLSHMQRTLWHIPVAAKLLDVPADQRNGPDDVGGTIALRVADATPRLFLTVNIAIVLAVVLVAAAMGVASVLYIALAPTNVGRLMIDSLVHTMTIAGRNEPAVPGACLAGFDDIFAAAGDERIQYGALAPATFNSCGHLGVGMVGGDHPVVRKPELGRWYGGGCSAELRSRKSYNGACVR
jgi:hypothetical protein